MKWKSPARTRRGVNELLVIEIATASKEQNPGPGADHHGGLVQMDQVTQSNAGRPRKRAAAAAEELQCPGDRTASRDLCLELAKLKLADPLKTVKELSPRVERRGESRGRESVQVRPPIRSWPVSRLRAWKWPDCGGKGRLDAPWSVPAAHSLIPMAPTATTTIFSETVVGARRTQLTAPAALIGDVLPGVRYARESPFPRQRAEYGAGKRPSRTHPPRRNANIPSGRLPPMRTPTTACSPSSSARAGGSRRGRLSQPHSLPSATPRRYLRS